MEKNIQLKLTEQARYAASAILPLMTFNSKMAKTYLETERAISNASEEVVLTQHQYNFLKMAYRDIEIQGKHAAMYLLLGYELFEKKEAEKNEML